MTFRQRSVSLILLCSILLISNARAFVPTGQQGSRSLQRRYLSTKLSAEKQPASPNTGRKPSSGGSRKDKKPFTLKDLREQIESKPTAFLNEFNPKKKKSNHKRSRQRTENPQQQYVYKKQRQEMERERSQQPVAVVASTNEGGDGAESDDPETAAPKQQQQRSDASSTGPIGLARENGLINPSAQHCDPLVDSNTEPQILGQIRVAEGDSKTSGSYAYIIHKPAGWAILGSNNNNNNVGPASTANSSSKNPQSNNKKSKTRLEFTGVDGSKSTLEYNDDALLSVMTPEEIAEYQLELKGGNDATADTADGDDADEKKPIKSSNKRTTKRIKVKLNEADDTSMKFNDDDDDEKDTDTVIIEEDENTPDEDKTEYVNMENIDFEERELLFDLTPEELEEYEQEMGPLEAGLKGELVEMHNNQKQQQQQQEQAKVAAAEAEEEKVIQETKVETLSQRKAKENDDNSDNTKLRPLDPKTKEVYSKIEARKSAAKSSSASFSPAARPSLVAWLKDLKGQEGNPMKGGKYWTALAGATSVDDSGIVILCPKEFTDNIFVDYLEYVAVVGNDNCLAPKQKGVDSIPKDEVSMETLSTVRRGRGADNVQTVKVLVQEAFSSCNSIIESCQQQFQDGVRGDPAGNPLGRLANRRLVHCNAVSVSSLVHDESIEIETNGVPDDIAILAERRNQHQFREGSFLGRAALRDNPLTTAYREINGAADGFPGWTVDRYGKFLFVQHDDQMPKGPLPSIHDGSTQGVYYLPANPNRSAMGSSPGADNALTRPQLMEGQPAPETIDILENGITYQVSLDKDLSTGIFLDQRPQRAWLARNCNEDTHVLNCFAHCGGYSIAAATAGASTTSIDLNKMWLDRVEPQLEANGIDYDIRHDCIYGDCFEWLAKLAKRGEKYDIVILDPPSASIGKKKKRWSIKNDMPELVTLASQVVKKGGLLWTTTNSASVTPVKFARLCRKGLDDAGLSGAKLERIQPMPHDFPSIGPQPVKNYVWRLP